MVDYTDIVTNKNAQQRRIELRNMMGMSEAELDKILTDSVVSDLHKMDTPTNLKKEEKRNELEVIVNSAGASINKKEVFVEKLKKILDTDEKSACRILSGEQEMSQEQKEKVDFIYEEDEFCILKRSDFDRNDILRIEKFPPYDLMVKSAYSGVALKNFVFFTHDYERFLVKRILNNKKFKNIKIDKNLVNLLIHTDNKLFRRKLFYPAFFIDADFEFNNRFVVKGMMVFDCNTNKVKDKGIQIRFDDGDVNDTRVHFAFIDKLKNDMTCFGVSLTELSNGTLVYAEQYALPEYKTEKEEIRGLLEYVVRIICNIIDLVEGNNEELEMKYVVPAPSQVEKRREKHKSPVTTTVIIKPKKELLSYTENFEREHRKVGYSHRFVVRGHWRHFNSEWYKGAYGKKTWIKPFLKGRGIMIKKDALFTDDCVKEES